MKNFIQPGNNITVPAPVGGTVSGTFYLIGSLLGCASTTQAATENVVLTTEGVFTVPKVSAQAWTVGQRVYWDDTAKNFTTTVGSNTLAGVAVEAAVNPSSTGVVRLNASF
jgi:predicted RecA/RadA family phage recombinase